MTDILSNVPDKKSSLEKCEYDLGCAAAKECFLLDIRQGLNRTATTTSAIEAVFPDDETVESKRDVLKEIRDRLAGCGIVLAAEEDYRRRFQS